MNTQNAEFLKKSLLNLGFGEKVNHQLDRELKQQSPEFKLSVMLEFNEKAIDYNLHFKAGDQNDMYFFNKYDAIIVHPSNAEKNVNQTFYINKGHGVTAKEAFNLIEGRSVQKTLTNLENQKYQAWLTLDDQNLTDSGNKKIKQYHENYGFDVEKVLEGKGIKEMADIEAKDRLLYSLRKGNPTEITINNNGENKKFFIAANPQFKTVDVYNGQMKKIKREEVLGENTNKTKILKKDEQQEEGLPQKKQSRKSKMKV